MTDIVANIRARHRIWHATQGMVTPLCIDCEQAWPCDAARAADEIESLQAKSSEAFEVALITAWQRDALAARLDAVQGLAAAQQGCDHLIPASQIRAALDAATPAEGASPPAAHEWVSQGSPWASHPGEPCRVCNVPYDEHPIHSGQDGTDG